MSQHPVSSPKKKPRLHWVVLASYCLFTLLLTHPLLFNLTTTVPSDIGDPLLNTWILAWDSHALLTDPLILFDANIFAPLPNTLTYSEHLFSTALVALPIQLIAAEPVVAYNLSLMITFPLAGLGMYLLTLHWTHRRDAAFIAGFIFAFAPYRFAAIAHLQLLTIQWLPFALLFFDKLFNPVEVSFCVTFRRRIFPFALFLGLQVLASWYLALYSAVILAIYGVMKLIVLGGLNRRQLRSLLLAGGLSLVMTLPFAWPYFTIVSQLQDARPLSLALSLASSPSDFFAAAPSNWLFGSMTEEFRTRPGFTEENTLFLGVITPLLGLAVLLTFIKKRSLDATRSIGIILSLILMTGLFILLTFPTPYAVLASTLSFTTVIRVPARWIIPALFAIAPLAAYGYLNLQSLITNNQLSKTLPLLLVIPLLLLETVSLPLPLAPVENRETLNPAYAWLTRQPEPFTLLELPLHSAPAPEFPEVKRLYASTVGWWPLINGYSGYTPPRQPTLAEALTNFPDKTALDALQIVSTDPLLLLIHPDEAPLTRPEWENSLRWQVERQPELLPLGQFEGDYLYALTSPADDFAVTPLATFGPNQAIELLGFRFDDPMLSSPQALPIEIEPSTDESRLILYWQTTEPLPVDATIFIHLRAADDFVRSQADGPPVSGHFPTTLWETQTVIQDIHPLPLDASVPPDHLAIGLYDPTTGKRFPAFASAQNRLVDDALIIPLTAKAD
ncbi:MAG: hypothetical protein AAF485_09315 [Chloroflexota bacterium]